MNIEDISLEILSANKALELLKKLVSEQKVNQELETAKELCKWLGYLPLGIELVGSYLVQKSDDWTLVKILEQLKEEKLHQQAINPQKKELTTAQIGVFAALELSWLELEPATQQVAILLSLFTADIFLREWVESMTQSLNWDDSDVEIAIEQLSQLHFLQFFDVDDEYHYKIHPLIREFLQIKLKASAQIKELKEAFCSTLIEIALEIPHSATLELTNSLKNVIPHLKEVVENLTDTINDEDLISAFLGLAGFYYGQGLYELAEPWYQQCISVVKSRLGENHPNFVIALNNLAQFYKHIGKISEAEPLYIKALELKKQLVGENHPNVVIGLNNLAFLYKSQGRYDEAETLYIKVLELRKQLLGENHTDIATSLNNLAQIYYSQGRFSEAETLYIQALELKKQLLGESHPNTATSLNNLAQLYHSQGKYDEAQPLYIQALEIGERILGSNHPHTMKYRTNLNDLRAQHLEARN